MGSHRLASRATLRARIQRLETEVQRLNAENAQLAGAATELASEVDAQDTENRALRSAMENHLAVTVPRWVRDTSHPADVATAPVDVRQLRDDHRDRTPSRTPRVITLHQRGQEAP